MTLIVAISYLHNRFRQSIHTSLQYCHQSSLPVSMSETIIGTLTATPSGGWVSCRIPTVLHIMPKRVLAHYATIIPKIFAHIMLALCRNFLKTRRAWRADLAHHHHFSAPCTNSVHKDWVTKGWKSVPEMDLAVRMAVRNSNTLRYGTESIHLHNSCGSSASESLLQYRYSRTRSMFVQYP